MDENHKKVLRESRPQIVQNLADVGAVCDQLIAYDVLTESMAEEIMSNTSKANKVRALLSVLVMRGPQAFDKFYQTMIITKNQTVADILKPPYTDLKLKLLVVPNFSQSLSQSNPKLPHKLTRTASLPSPTSPEYSSAHNLQRTRTVDREFRVHPLSRQEHLEEHLEEPLDDDKTEYGEYTDETAQKYQTESLQVFSLTAQVSEQDDLSTGVLVSGLDHDHNSHFVSAISSQERDIHRDMDSVQNVHHSAHRWGSVPSETTTSDAEPSNISLAQSEQGYNIHVPSNDEYGGYSGEPSATSPSEEFDELESEVTTGMAWPRTRKHSRPLAHLTIRQPSPSRQRKHRQQLCKDTSNNQVYLIDPKFQRRLVIINNSVFLPTTGLPPRTTGNIDATSLDLLFRKLRYNIKTYSDCSCQRMKDVLRAESKMEAGDQIETFIVVILSHGNGEKIYGAEGGEIDIRDITQLFDQEHCPALGGKPKLFFISACRPQQNMSSGQDCVDAGQENVEYDSLSLGMLNSLISVETEDGRIEPSDMFVARATSQCNATFEGLSFGSQFIQALIHVIKENSFTDDLVTLMEKMNQLVKRPHQSPLVEYTKNLRKKFYFFPDLGTSEHSLAMTM